MAVRWGLRRTRSSSIHKGIGLAFLLVGFILLGTSFLISSDSSSSYSMALSSAAILGVGLAFMVLYESSAGASSVSISGTSINQHGDDDQFPFEAARRLNHNVMGFAHDNRAWNHVEEWKRRNMGLRRVEEWRRRY